MRQVLVRHRSVELDVEQLLDEINANLGSVLQERLVSALDRRSVDLADQRALETISSRLSANYLVAERIELTLRYSDGAAYQREFRIPDPCRDHPEVDHGRGLRSRRSPPGHHPGEPNLLHAGGDRGYANAMDCVNALPRLRYDARLTKAITSRSSPPMMSPRQQPSIGPIVPAATIAPGAGPDRPATGPSSRGSRDRRRSGRHR